MNEDKKRSPSFTASNPFQEGVFLIFLFTVFILLFSWPYISLLGNGSFELAFFYFFGIWALLIIILFFASNVKESELTDTQEND